MGRIACVGSINADYTYRVPHLPAAGETLAAKSLTTMLGGKGANQAVAAANSGAKVAHIGAVGPGAGPLLATLTAAGADLSGVAELDVPTGHAIIAVDDAGENSILLFPGANHALPEAHVMAALQGYGPGDLCLLQNEINATAAAAQCARALGMTVIYSAAPFETEAVRALAGVVDLVVVNEVEHAQLVQALRDPRAALGCDLLVTLGGDGARYEGAERHEQAAFPVTPVDTTGAGDCYIGSFAALRAQGATIPEAMRWAAAAAALQITRPGTAEAMPDADEIRAFLKA